MSSPTARTIWNFIKIVFALLLIWLVLAQTDLSQLPVMLGNISPYWGLLAVLIYMGLTALKALQYYIILRGKIAYSKVVNVIIIQNAVSNLLASGAGIASYMTLLRVEHDVKAGRSMVMFLMIKVGDLIAIWLLFLISTWMIWADIAVIHNLIIALLLIIGIFIAIFFLTLIARQRFVFFIKWFLTFSKLSKIKLIKNGVDFLETIVEVDQIWLFRRLIFMLALSSLYFVASIIWNYVIFLAFNFRVDIPSIIFVNVLLQLISYFPIQVFGGLGVAETSSLYFWSLFGISQSFLAPILVGNRILFYLLNLISLIYLPLHSLFSRKSPDLQNNQDRQ